MLTSFVHRVRDKYYFNCPEKVHFYTSLPSYEVFNDSFRACSSTFVTTTWFYNIKQISIIFYGSDETPFARCIPRFSVLICSVPFKCVKIFSSWINAMDLRLSVLFIGLTENSFGKLCRYTFNRKVIVIIDCFEVFIDRPTNLLARAQLPPLCTFSNIKGHLLTPKRRQTCKH